MKQIFPGYTLIRELGEGGMCVVYLARHEAFKEEVAVKVLHEHFSRQEEMRLRFLDEARIMRNLHHEGIVNVRALLQFDDRVALVMDYIEGKTLDHLIGHEIGPIPSEQAVPLFRQILKAVDYAHAQGVVHRDLKPSNILVNDSNQVKVTDFGIAKVIGASGMTRTGAKLGTLCYMSPEQIKCSRDVDYRSDVYSLGMTLYEMLAGRLPFETRDDTSEFEITQKIVFNELEPPNTYYPHIPSPLVRAVLKATAKDPAKRYQTCSEFLEGVCGTSVKQSSKKQSVSDKEFSGDKGVKNKITLKDAGKEKKNLSQNRKEKTSPSVSTKEPIGGQTTKGVEGTEGRSAFQRDSKRFVPFLFASITIVLVTLVSLAIHNAHSLDRFQIEGDIITDAETGLEWRVGPDSNTDWDSAKEWAGSLGDSWRMPTHSELKALFYAGIHRGNWGPFENTGWLVWSGEDSDSASACYFGFGTLSERYGLWSRRDYRVFAVRSR